MFEDETVIPEKIIELIRRIFSKNDPVMNGGLDFEMLNKLFIKKEPITKTIETYINQIKILKEGD
ncbi:hypothetical protein LCGC14_0525740 [marine sediment metagenome]|uniref:Uncharacterized protein n=1 Tax=marine sediment metagenome TaxID=412755 RepID=A0A0F9UIK3_9ZZZZ|nr:hypothetical protein [bacterium]